jgi:heme-degrading monooxygenase HmoA
MFSRIVSMQVKPNSNREFTELFQEKLIPILRQQQGFKDEMLFQDPGGPEVVAISLWESRENAEAYARAAYPELLKILAKVIESNPKVKTYQVSYSTLHKIGAAFPPQSPNITPAAGVGG